MLRRLGIRGKVLAALSVPVLVLFLLAGVVSLGSIREAQTARTVTTMLTALQESRDVVTAMQAERRSALPYVAGDSSVEAEKESAREVTDESITAFERAVARVDLDALDGSVSQAVAELRAAFTSLDGIRGRVDAQGVPISAIFNNYARLIDDTISFTTAVADGLDDRRLAAIISANGLVTSLVEDYNSEQALGAEVIDGSRGTDVITFLGTLFPATDLAHERATAAVDALRLGEDVVVPPLGASWDGFQSYASYRTLVGTGADRNLNFVDSERWTTAAADEIRAFTPIDSKLRMEANDRARAVASAALRTSALTIGGSLAAVVLSIVAALAIARQIIQPLRRLTDAAEVVREELPRLVDQVAVPGQGPDLSLTQIPVVGNDEVSHLAAAFNEVNSTTITVAQEQAALRGSIAEMFVNVARRDQALLNRQLSFIDALERSEEDPTTLADLFRLDHLATRMRRNAESLLVLAGIDTGRRLRDPLPISDVIRTASSEIEHYERVQLDLPVDPMMLGHTALPAAHMLAELLENATVFSEPGTPVHVSTGVDEDHVLVTILDHGLGMTPEELAEANNRMLATSAGEVLGSERLGMFVVGRIAARLGAEAHLSVGPDGAGTLATIRLPLVLFTDAASIPHTAPSQAPRVETFSSIDQVAGAAPAVAEEPVPATVGDVAPGAVGSTENPAEEIDLGALTDGSTGRGLPRRRSRTADVGAPAPSQSYRDADDAAAAPSIPLAPRAESLAGAATGTDEEVWTPPVVQESTPLVPRRAAAAEPEAVTPEVVPDGPALPTRRSARADGLPVRTPAPPVADPAASAGPADAAGDAAAVTPENRAQMFSGFRSRRAELAAAAIQVDTGDGTDAPISTQDGAERLAAAAAGAAAFFGRSPAAGAAEPVEDPEPPMVIPALVDDDEEYGDPVYAPQAPVVGPVMAAPAVGDPALGEPADQVYGDVVEQPLGDLAAGQGGYPSSDQGPWSADDEAEVEWPPAPPVPAASAEPQTPAVEVAPVDATPVPFAPAVSATPEESTGFNELVAGEAPAERTSRRDSRRDNRRDSRPAKRRWFQRKPAEPTTPPVAETPTDFTPVVGFGVGQPLPPSAWDLEALPARDEAEGTALADTAATSPATPPGGVPAAGQNGSGRPAAFLPEPSTEQGPSTWLPQADHASSAPAVPEPVQQAEPAVWSEPPVQQPETFHPEPVAETFQPVDATDSFQPGPVPPTASFASEQLPVVPSPHAAPEPTRSEPMTQESAEPQTPTPHTTTPQTFTPQTFTPQTFTPQSSSGVDDEVTSMLAQRADLAQQALAELSQLSTYRPKTAPGGGSSLARRTPGTIPAAPEIKTAPAGRRTERDAHQVRSLLSSFQSGTSRGRQAVGSADGADATPGNGAHPPGGPPGPDDHGDPVTAMDADLTQQRSTSW